MTRFRLRSLTLIVLLSLLGCHRSGSGAGRAAQDPEVPAQSVAPGSGKATERGDLVKALNEFAMGIYRAAGDSKRNNFLSPLSVYTALAMTATGASGQLSAPMPRTAQLTGRCPLRC